VLFFLLAMIAAAIFSWEPWPITSFRLFSHLRQDQQHGWEATVIDRDGREAPLAISDLASGFHGFRFRMAEFESARWQRRDEICQAWVAPLLGTDSGPKAEIRLYRLEWRLSRRIDGGERAAAPARALAFVCSAAGARGKPAR
jgi:hypothetical protein